MCCFKSTRSRKAGSIVSIKFEVAKTMTLCLNLSLSRPVRSELTTRMASAGSFADVECLRDELIDSTSSNRRKLSIIKEISHIYERMDLTNQQTNKESFILKYTAESFKQVVNQFSTFAEPS